jgi:hypothetical protein
LALLQSVTYLVVRHANREHALAQIDARLRVGAQVFKKLIEQRSQQIMSAAAILSRDHAFLEAFAGADHDRATTLSALESLRGRLNAERILIASLEKQLLFDTRQPERRSVPFPFPKLADKAVAALSGATTSPSPGSFRRLAVLTTRAGGRRRLDL